MKLCCPAAATTQRFCWKDEEQKYNRCSANANANADPPATHTHTHPDPGDLRGRPHLIMGDSLGLGDELSAANSAVGVSEKALVHL